MNNTVFQKLTYGMYIVSTMDDGRATGCAANSAMQITWEPHTVAVSINKNNYTNKCIKECKKFALTILDEDTEPLLIGTFGFQTGKNVNKFEGIEFKIVEEMPVIKNTCGYVVCQVIDTMETETHTVFLGKVIEGDVFDGDKKPMTYAYYHQVIKGTSPKNAPTYIEK